MEKIKYKIAGIILVALALLSSCEPNFEIQDKNNMTESSFYKTSADFQMGLIAAYQELVDFDGGYGRWMYYNLLGLDDGFSPTYKCQNATILSAVYTAYYTPSPNGIGEITAWQGMYRGVFACNIIIDKLAPITDTTAVSTKDKNLILGQAHFLKGLYYLHLATLYGETIPLVDHVATTTAELSPNNSLKGIIYPYIVNEFKTAINLLPNRSVMYADPSNIGRATKGSAQGYLARTYLYRPLIDGGQPAEFSKAKDVLSDIINSKEYDLMKSYRDNFTDVYENNKESLFEVQFLVTSTVPNHDNNNVTWRMQEAGLPDGTAGAWWNMAPNPHAYREFENGDPRRFMTLWCPGGAKFLNGRKPVTFSSMVKLLTGDKDLYGCRKYCYDQAVPKIETGINDRLMRYSDVLLMYAECLHELGQDGTNSNDNTGAKYYIQLVRNRANNVIPAEDAIYETKRGQIVNVDQLIGKDTLINGEKIMSVKDAIVHERSVEFCGEYLRYFDLRRWAATDTKYNNYLLNKYNGDGRTNGFDPSKQGAFPIPQPELDNNKNLKGNDWN